MGVSENRPGVRVKEFMGREHVSLRNSTRVKLYIIHNTPGYWLVLQEMTVIKGI